MDFSFFKNIYHLDNKNNLIDFNELNVDNLTALEYFLFNNQNSINITNIAEQYTDYLLKNTNLEKINLTNLFIKSLFTDKQMMMILKQADINKKTYYEQDNVPSFFLGYQWGNLNVSTINSVIDKVDLYYQDKNGEDFFIKLLSQIKNDDVKNKILNEKNFDYLIKNSNLNHKTNDGFNALFFFIENSMFVNLDCINQERFEYLLKNSSLEGYYLNYIEQKEIIVEYMINTLLSYDDNFLKTILNKEITDYFLSSFLKELNKEENEIKNTYKKNKVILNKLLDKKVFFQDVIDDRYIYELYIYEKNKSTNYDISNIIDDKHKVVFERVKLNNQIIVNSKNKFKNKI